MVRIFFIYFLFLPLRNKLCCRTDRRVCFFYNETPCPPPPRFTFDMTVPSSGQTYIALFNYGGGMRGLIPAHLMAYIEEATDLRMAEMVDIFAGPSTGAILNGALTLRQLERPTEPKYRARHMVRFYEREGLKIFPRDRFREFRGIVHDFNNRTLKLNRLNDLFRHGHYDPSHLSRSLQALYGDAKLADSLRTLIVPTYNIDGSLEAASEPGLPGDAPAPTINNITDKGGNAIWLKNVLTGYPDNVRASTPDVSLYDAVMASCAAPTYFPCHHFSIGLPSGKRTQVSAIDGNIFDNPCISYLGAIRRNIPPGARLIMIVLGTGYTNRSYRKEQWNRFGSLGVVDPVNDLPLINIFFHASESALMEGFAEELGDDLFVFNKSMVGQAILKDVPTTQIDDASPDNLMRMRVFSQALIEEQRQRLDDLCQLLVSHHDARRQDTRDGVIDRTRKYFSFFTGMRNTDRTTVEDSEA